MKKAQAHYMLFTRPSVRSNANIEGVANRGFQQIIRTNF